MYGGYTFQVSYEFLIYLIKGASKYGVTRTNIQPYSTSNCLISEVLSNEFKTYTKEKKFSIKYKVLENCVTKRGIRLYIFTRPSLTHATFPISWIIIYVILQWILHSKTYTYLKKRRRKIVDDYRMTDQDSKTARNCGVLILVQKERSLNVI